MDQEEIEVLQSIFEDQDIFFYNKKKQTCKLFIPIETESLPQLKLKYLPPIKLIAKTPKCSLGDITFTYPDVLPLDIELSASWLNEDNLKQLNRRFFHGNLLKQLLLNPNIISENNAISLTFLDNREIPS